MAADAEALPPCMWSMFLLSGNRAMGLSLSAAGNVWPCLVPQENRCSNGALSERNCFFTVPHFCLSLSFVSPLKNSLKPPQCFSPLTEGFLPLFLITAFVCCWKGGVCTEIISCIMCRDISTSCPRWKSRYSCIPVYLETCACQHA